MGRQCERIQNVIEPGCAGGVYSVGSGRPADTGRWFIAGPASRDVGPAMNQRPVS